MLTGAEVEESTVLEVVPEAEVTIGAATELAETAAPGWAKRCVAMHCRMRAWR
jgi:hypothetical protein